MKPHKKISRINYIMNVMMLNNGTIVPNNNVIHGGARMTIKQQMNRSMNGGSALPKLMENLSLFDVSSKVMSGKGLRKPIKFII